MSRMWLASVTVDIPGRTGKQSFIGVGVDSASAKTHLIDQIELYGFTRAQAYRISMRVKASEMERQVCGFTIQLAGELTHSPFAE